MYFIDASHNSLTKYNEELCGDCIQQVNLKDSKIFVLADGLGSGVKANILSTLTSKIAITMLREGATLEETIDTIVHTLPVCKQRHLAYSTFTLIKIYRNGDAYAAEFDNPELFLHRNGEDIPLDKTLRIFGDKKVYESRFKLDKDTMLVVVSDGVVHAGIGHSLDLGWERVNVNKYLRDMSKIDATTKDVVKNVLEYSNDLYEGEPGDDTSVLAIKIKEQEVVNLFIGPPRDRKNDTEVFGKVLRSGAKVAICGGTTAQIASRLLDKEMEFDMDTMTMDIPPIAAIDGVELVTEGVITLSKAIDIIRECTKPDYNPRLEKRLHENNGASMLAKLLIEECDGVKIYQGAAINPAHQDLDFKMDFIFKVNQIKELTQLLEKLGKDVEVTYI
ncbi:MAG: serine/threonine-protein phosphatase [Clostridiales bacterium]|nr:serine/threonine-protein phosphatase [Clostridiales bacterium]